MSEILKHITHFDVLGDVLDTMRFRGSIFFYSELAAPWGVSLTQESIPRFHIALSGDCFVGIAGDDAVKVQQNEIIMLLGGSAHWIADQPGRKLVSSTRAGEACELGEPLFQQGKVTHRIMCGLVHYDNHGSHPILDSVPDVLHFPKLNHNTPIWMTVMLIDAEMRRTQKQSGTIVDRLTEVLFLQLLNYYVEENDEVTGFFSALRDQRVNRALMLIHQDPGFQWSLSTLGARVGMSRATLIRHFQHKVGVSPMAYINNWRIMKAFNLIKHSSESLEQIAAMVGFASARTLNKAFQRHYGYTPSELRTTVNA